MSPTVKSLTHCKSAIALRAFLASRVSDCQILDPLQGASNSKIASAAESPNNTIVDRRAQPIMRHAIRVIGQSRDNLVTGNTLSSATEKLLLEADNNHGQVRDSLVLR